MSECLIYQLKPGRTTVNIILYDLLLFLTFTSKVGRMDSEKAVHIRLSGDNILEEHCYLENTDGKVTLHALPDAITVRLYPLYSRAVCNSMQFLNGKQISADQVRLSLDDRVPRLKQNLIYSASQAPLWLPHYSW